MKNKKLKVTLSLSQKEIHKQISEILKSQEIQELEYKPRHLYPDDFLIGNTLNPIIGSEITVYTKFKENSNGKKKRK